MKKFGTMDFKVLLLYMDGMLIVSQSLQKISKLKYKLAKSFEMKDLGHA